MFILFSTGIVFITSTYEENGFSIGFLSWFESFYFVLVTVSTVGYGDITPDTDLTRAIVILIIIVGFSLIPVQVTTLVQALFFSPKYLGSYHKKPLAKHVVIAGIVDFELLDRFLSDIFHPAHYSEGSVIEVVILSPIPPTVSHSLVFLLFFFLLFFFANLLLAFFSPDLTI